MSFVVVAAGFDFRHNPNKIEHLLINPLLQIIIWPSLYNKDIQLKENDNLGLRIHRSAHNLSVMGQKLRLT